MAQAVLKETDHDALAEQVLARQRFIQEIISFVGVVLREHGKQLSYVEHSAHTTSENELKNFGDFSYYSYGAYSMYGGEQIKVWYHPGKKFPGGPPTLEVEWWEIKECKVLTFDPSPAWQRAIERLIKNKNIEVARIAKERKEKEEQEKAKQERETELRKVREKTLEEAKRLKIIV